MQDMKDVVALLVDLVESRSDERALLHEAVLAATETVNATVEALEPLHPTVGDELQGIYPTVGAALAASYTFRLALAPDHEARFGIGGGDVRIIDPARGIQDGSAWWRAREAIDWVAAQADRKGHGSARTCIRDGRAGAWEAADPLARLIDANLVRLRDGATGSLRGMWEGLDNDAIAQREGISSSANSQRVIGNALRPLHDAMTALASLP